VNVDDVSGSVSKAEELGGKTVMPATDMPQVTIAIDHFRMRLDTGYDSIERVLTNEIFLLIGESLMRSCDERH
jgi:hypothetical protein